MEIDRRVVAAAKHFDHAFIAWKKSRSGDILKG
jgi:hypothetical protein